MRTAVSPEAIWPPKCGTCQQVMRLVGIEQDPDMPQIRFQTFECACGELAVCRAAYH
jgi:hypothetical protein